MKQFFRSPFDKIKQRVSLKRQRGFLLNPARFAAGGGVDIGDPHWDNVVGYYRFNEPNGSTQSVDYSWAARNLSRNGTASVVTSGALRGSASASIPNSANSAFFVTNSEEQNISSGDFTIELIYRNTAAPQEFARLFQTRDGDTFAGISILAAGSGGVRQFQLYLSSNGTSFGIANGVGVTSYSADTTYHLALSRQGSTFRFFINGAVVATITSGASIYYVTTDRTIIGGNSTSTSRSVGGLIDEVRITKGIARYTAAFTPPAAEFINRGLIDIHYDRIVFALNMNGRNASTLFSDLSAVRKIQTANGNVQVSTTDSKYGGACALFDGTGDFITTPTTGDFDLGTVYTIEFFIKPNSLATNFGVLHRGFYTTTAPGTWEGLAFSIRWLGTAARFYFFGTTAATEQYIDVADAFSTSEWRHIAMVRNGTTGTVYVNGVLSGTITGLNTSAASTQTLRIGRWDFSAGNEDFNGRLDDVKISRGVAKYSSNFTPPAVQQSLSGPVDSSYSSVVALVKFEGPTGVTATFDSTAKRLWTNNNISISTAQRRFGLTSGLTVGGRWISTPASADFNFGTGDFTIEGWVYTTSTNDRQAFIGQMNSGITDASFQFEITSGFFRTYAFTTGGTTVLYNITGTTAVALNTWYHVATVRSGTTIYLFVNGVLDATATGITGAVHSSTANLSIGRSGDYELLTFVGHLDEFRITKGLARYTSAFTPPAAPFPAYGA